MSKIFYYIWIAMWVALGLPIVAVIISVIYIQSKWHQLTCKMCKKK
jgi:hypothetical protein